MHKCKYYTKAIEEPLTNLTHKYRYWIIIKLTFYNNNNIALLSTPWWYHCSPNNLITIFIKNFFDPEIFSLTGWHTFEEPRSLALVLNTTSSLTLHNKCFQFIAFILNIKCTKQEIKQNVIQTNAVQCLAFNFMGNVSFGEAVGAPNCNNTPTAVTLTDEIWCARAHNI